MCVWIKWTHRRKRLKCECPYICRQDSELRKRVYNVAQWKPFWLKAPLNYIRTVYSTTTSSNIQNTPTISGVSNFFYSKKATKSLHATESDIKRWFFLLILFHRNTHGGNVPWIFKWFIHHFWMKQKTKMGMESRRSRRWHISLLKWRAEWNIVV